MLLLEVWAVDPCAAADITMKSMSLPESSKDLSADLAGVDFEQDDDKLAFTASWPPRSWYMELSWKLGSFSRVFVATCSFGLAVKRCGGS